MIKSLVLLFVLYVLQVNGHGFMTCPQPRQRRDKPPKHLENQSWHGNWISIVVPGSLDFSYGIGDVGNLNSGLGGGDGGEGIERSEGRGLCGDIAPDSKRALSGRKGGFFMSNPTSTRGTYVSGGELKVNVKITAYHGGHFEFRLCDDAKKLSQECFNKNVLKISPKTKSYFPHNVFDYSKIRSVYKCVDENPQKYFPRGSCCNQGGLCSDPGSNDDRWVLPPPQKDQGDSYEITLQIPDDLVCEHCVLQWYYQTANSDEHYPESFINCADIEIISPESLKVDPDKKLGCYYNPEEDNDDDRKEKEENKYKKREEEQDGESGKCPKGWRENIDSDSLIGYCFHLGQKWFKLDEWNTAGQ